METFLKILSVPFTIVFYLLFGITILLFHPIQWVCYNWFGYQAHKKSVDIQNWFHVRSLQVLGTTFHIDIHTSIPNNVPLILVSNHQSMWDISPIIWYLRRYHPKFISKIELGKGIPSISYNLRYGGSILIDRKNPRQALGEMLKFSKYLSQFKRTGVIFPEGTRSKDGVPKPFKTKGMETLFAKVKDGYVLPVTINNSWQLQRWGMFPMPLGVRFEMTVHPSLKISEYGVEELAQKVEEIITSKIHK